MLYQLAFDTVSVPVRSIGAEDAVRRGLSMAAAIDLERVKDQTMSVVPFPPMKRPLVAILRGVRPEEAEDIVSVLIDSGMTAIEIPLNSPDPFRSIEIAVRKAPAGILVGAGTVLTLEAVERLHDVGGRLLVTPQCRS